MEMPKLTRIQPHLFQAYYAWMVENAAKIMIYVDAVRLTDEFLKSKAGPDGTLALDVTPQAVRFLSTSQEGISFHTRFKGVVTPVVIPFEAFSTLAGWITGYEEPVVLVFPMVEDVETLPTPPQDNRPKLTVVK